MPEAKAKNPLWMSILVAVLFCAGLVHLVYMFTGVYAPYGNLLPAAIAILTVVAFAGLSGVLSAEKWGVWVYAVAAALVPVCFSFTGGFHWAQLLPILPLAAFLPRLNKMN
jgi:hypothetical protein